MVSKRVSWKDTVESSTGEAIEQVLVNFLVYAYTQMFIEKDMKLKWDDIKDIFVEDFKEDLEDSHVYINIHWSCLHKVACMYPTFLDIIH